MKHSKWYCDDCGQEFRFGESHYCPNRVANKEKIINDMRLEELHAQDINTDLTLNFNPDKPGDNDPTANINWEVTGKIIKVGGNNDIIFNFTDIVEQLKRIADALEKIANK